MSVLRAQIIALAALAIATQAAAETATSEIRADAARQPAPEVRMEAVDDSALAALSGGDAVAITDQTLSAVNTGNTINAGTVTNGAVSLEANAFSGFAGIGNFVINTGNNNNLQGSLSVNIVMTPGAN